MPQPNYYEAELHRLRGELLLNQNPNGDQREQALRSFREARSIAARQQALSLELRAAISLARVARDQGRGDEIRSYLEPICARLTEGFNTPDWCAATELLATS